MLRGDIALVKGDIGLLKVEIGELKQTQAKTLYKVITMQNEQTSQRRILDAIAHHLEIDVIPIEAINP